MTPEEQKEMEAELARIESADVEDENYDASTFNDETPELEVNTGPVELGYEDDASTPDPEVIPSVENVEVSAEDEIPANVELEVPAEEIPLEAETSNPEPEDNDFISLDDDSKKLRVTYFGEDTDIPAKDVKNLVQIGIDAQNKGYKEAVNKAKKLESLRISDSDLEVLAKLKAGDPGALKELLATSKLDLESVRTDVFEYEQSDVEAMRSANVPQERTEFEIMGDRLSTNHIDSYMKSIETFPELDTFRQRLIDSGDTATFDSFLNHMEAGTFTTAAPKAAVAFSQLNDSDRIRVTSNPKSFTNFINPFLQDAVSHTSATSSSQSGQSTSTPSETPLDSNTPVDKHNDAVPVSQKAAYSKPVGQPPALGNGTKTKADEIAELTAKYEAMDDDSFMAGIRSGTLQK